MTANDWSNVRQHADRDCRMKRDLTKLTPAQRTALILRVNKNTHTPTTQADRDRNAAIGGRGPVNSKDQ
jgi:hypothetical protein